MNENTTDIVILELDPPRELKLGHRALKAFCARTRLGVNEIGQVLQRYDMMALLIQVMLQCRYPDLTEDQIDEMLETLPLETVYNKASAAVMNAFPTAAGTSDDGESQGPFANETTGPAA